MRKIKFRAFCKAMNRWLCPDSQYMVMNGSVVIAAPWSTIAFRQDDDNFIIQQYTGCDDKNGEEIYEGDIIKAHNHNFLEEVIFLGSSFGFFRHDNAKKQDGNFEYLSDYTSSGGYEIVGNICETPELI